MGLSIMEDFGEGPEPPDNEGVHDDNKDKGQEHHED